MTVARLLFYLLTLFLLASHIGINFVAELNRFLVAENVVLATLYAVGLLAFHAGSRWGALLVGVVALFSAGRVSRSIIGSRGEVGELAAQHVPLMLLDLAVGLLGVLLACK